MKRFGFSALLFLAVLSVNAPAAHAGVYGDALSKCLVDSTTPADRALLGEWFFATMALNPSVKSWASVADGKRTEINQRTAALFQNLLTDKCHKQTKDAVAYEGTATLESSFNVLGQIAGREILGNPAVTAGMKDFVKYFDQAKMNELLPPATK